MTSTPLPLCYIFICILIKNYTKCFRVITYTFILVILDFIYLNVFKSYLFYNKIWTHLDDSFKQKLDQLEHVHNEE